MKRVLIVFLYMVLGASTVLAQDSEAEALQRRLGELEAQIEELKTISPAAQIEELRRQIDILTREIETLKTEQQRPAAADVQQFGLGAAASKVYRSGPGVSFGGYGEALYENYDSAREDGVVSGKIDQADFLRAILYTGFKFNDRVVFNSEMEVEHASTKDAVGEVSMEFAYLDFFIRPELNVRAGLLLVPMGLINELHEPTAFLGAKRPEIEVNVIPSTWRENGVGLFGDIGSVTYRTYLVTGLRSEKFGAAGVRSGRQQGAKAKAEDFALVGRVDWSVVEGASVGGSIYSGDSAQGRTMPSGESFDGRVTMLELHADARVRGFVLRGLWVEGTIDDAREINRANGLTGRNSIGEEMGGWYAEAGYDLATLFSRGESAVIPFIRYEAYDTQRAVPSGFERNGERDVQLFTAGVHWKPIPQAAVKLDFQKIENEANTGVDQVNLALGYIF